MADLRNLFQFMKGSTAMHSDDSVITPDLLRQLAYSEKMAELGEISAGVVHELNAPLSVIISASQMIMREEGVPVAVQEMISRISLEAQRLSHLTKGLLNFSSHDDSTVEVDINHTVEFILNFLNYEVARRGIIVLKQLDYTLPFIFLNPNLLKQVLLNIIMNALQAMGHEGGKLIIETATFGNRYICVSIADNGPGIPSESIGKIFDRYFTTKKSGEGTGLGLFVTRKLIESIGGEIKVSSRLGGGCHFSVLLPINMKLSLD